MDSGGASRFSHVLGLGINVILSSAEEPDSVEVAASLRKR